MYLYSSKFMKFYSHKDAVKAILADGNNICSMSYVLRDNEEIAWLAIENGASISAVSFRLQNDLSFSLKYAKYCSSIGIVEEDFFRALYCSIHSLELLETYASKFANNPEFIILLKLFLEDKYTAPISALNDYSGDTLHSIISQYHIDLVNELKEEYYSSSYQEMLMQSGFQPANYVRNFALCARSENLPFNHISKIIRKTVESLDAHVDCFRSRTGVGSFPERFMDALLKQLDVTFEREVVFSWSKPSDANKLKGCKRYDFYLPRHNTIIEVHGAQHYSGGFEVFGGRSLEEEKENDCIKLDIAIKNGISNYIVINAAISSISYLKESIMENSDFMALFDVSGIDWIAIKQSILGELPEDLPLYKLEKSYYESLSDIFSSVSENDEIAPQKAFGEGCAEETEELKEWKKTVHPSKRGLYPHEIVLLSRAKGIPYPVNSDKTLGTWFYDYGIKNIRPLVERLGNNGFLHIGDLKCTLECAKYAKVRSFASRNGLGGNGKKEDIVSRILANVPYQDIQDAFPEKFYDLTELGVLEVNENSYIFDAVAVPLLNPLTRIWIAQNNPDTDIGEAIAAYCHRNDGDEAEGSSVYYDGDEMYQIDCVLDRCTCEICGSMDQKVFKYSEKKVGVTYPPFHEGCRCRAVPYFDDLQGCERAARDRAGRTIYVKNMDWSKWKQIYGGKVCESCAGKEGATINTEPNVLSHTMAIHGSSISTNQVPSHPAKGLRDFSPPIPPKILKASVVTIPAKEIGVPPPAGKKAHSASKKSQSMLPQSSGEDMDEIPILSPSVSSIPKTPIPPTNNKSLSQSCCSSVETGDYSFTTTAVLSMLFGHLGIHRFYTGRVWTGGLCLITGGGVLIWSTIDIIRILSNKYTDHKGKRLKDYTRNKAAVVFVCWITAIYLFALLVSSVDDVEPKQSTSVAVQNGNIE